MPSPPPGTADVGRVPGRRPDYVRRPGSMPLSRRRAHDVRHHIRLVVVPRRLRCRRRWYVLAVIVAGCRRHLQERADVLAAYGCP